MTILLAYRPTPEGAAALDVAIGEARHRKEELLIVRHIHVEASDTAIRDRSAKIEADLERLGREVQEQGLACRTTWTIGPEKASRAILEVAGREQPTLIVIGVQRRSPVGKLFLGSDAQDILLHADAPVLAVKEPAA